MSRLMRTALSVLILAGFGLSACTADFTFIPSLTPTPLRATGTALASTATRPVQRTPAAPTATPKPVSQLGATTDSLEGLAVQFWHPWSGELARTVESLAGEFNASNQWGIQIQPVSQGSYEHLAEVVAGQLVSGTLPDLVAVYPYQALSWEGSRQPVDLSVYASDPVWGLSEQAQAGIYPAFWQAPGKVGSQLGFPAQRYGQGLFYNLSWARELGFSAPPATVEDFERQACAAAEANWQDDNPDNDGTGGWIVSHSYPAVLGWMFAFGSEIVKDDGSNYQFATPQVREAFTYLRRLYDLGCAWQAPNTPPLGEFASRQGLFAAGQLTDIPYQERAFARAGNPDEWTIIPFPSPPTQQPALFTYGPSFYVFPSRVSRQLAAWLFVRWLLEPGQQAHLAAAGDSLPLTRAALEAMQEYRGGHPQWAAAADALDDARPEPALKSWNVVRWIVQDSATQLFMYYTTLKDVPDITSLLNRTAADLHNR